MSVFDKSFPDYRRLSDFFVALNAYQLHNEVDVTEEQDTESEAKLIVNWTLTMSDQTTNSTEHRTGEIKITFARKDKSWRIVSLSPVQFFDPSLKR